MTDQQHTAFMVDWERCRHLKQRVFDRLTQLVGQNYTLSSTETTLPSGAVVITVACEPKRDK